MDRVGDVEDLPHDLQRLVPEAFEAISDANIAVSGTYDLNASLNEVICG